MDVIDITAKCKPVGWKEVMAGPKMATWIRRHSDSDWQQPFPGVYWLSPRLFMMWRMIEWD